MITVTHCPKFGIFMAYVQRPYGTLEFNYREDGKLAYKGEPVAYSRKENITKPANHVLAISTISATHAEAKAVKFLQREA